MHWISEHSNTLNLLVNIGMFFVWVAYLQLFLVSYLRARKPRIILTRGKGKDVDSVCLVSNMSQEPIYPQSIYCTIHHRDRTCAATITDKDVLQQPGEERPEGVTSHGPLNRGDFMSIGTFRNLLDITTRCSDDWNGHLEDLGEGLESLEILVVAAFGGDDLEIAAKREFQIDTTVDPWNVVPVGPRTEQVSSRSERKRLRRLIIEELSRESPGL